MSAVRLRRLEADHEKLKQYVSRHPRVQLLQADGTPPERYQLQYQIVSLQQKDDQLVEAKTHVVEIALPRNYPRTPPQCRMLTPIFHPNIAPHAICIGDHWSAGEPLAAIVARIGELIAYQSYNIKSPLNGEAARWVSENIERLPLDPVTMVIDDAGPLSAEPVTPASYEFPCDACGARLRVPKERSGKQIRCPRCKAVVKAPAISPPA
jgi:ubiquitin-protein ligase/DNA-directed RNA polymerase subunit RPC12/RpoP